MRTLILSLLLGIGICPSFRPDNTTGPAIKFEKEVVNFGKIPFGKPAHARFSFVNTGGEPLIISDVEPSCGCTVATYTLTAVKAGGRGVINVTFDATGLNSFSKEIVVKSNAVTPLVILYIKGTVVANSHQ